MSDGSLKAIVVVSRISVSFEAELSSLLRTQPLFSSQDQASCAEETGLGAADICASRSGRGEKSRAFCGDVVFWLLLVPRESVRLPGFCLRASLILWRLDRKGWAHWGKDPDGRKGGVGDVGEELSKESEQLKGEERYLWWNLSWDPDRVPIGKGSRSILGHILACTQCWPMFTDPRRAQITRQGRWALEKSEAKKAAAKRQATRRSRARSALPLHPDLHRRRRYVSIISIWLYLQSINIFGEIGILLNDILFGSTSTADPLHNLESWERKVWIARLLLEQRRITFQM